jgi:hypothetical protein
MSTEDNKATVRRFFEEVHNQGNVAAVDELLNASKCLMRGNGMIREK